MYSTLLAINNFFERTSEYGSYAISENAITATRGEYKVGQYVRIMNSLLNDGVYKITAVESVSIELSGTLVDEEFDGYIVGLAIPASVVAIAAKVEAFTNRGISSESIPNYSISFNAKSGVEAYATDLAPYKKLFVSPYYFLNWVRVYD